MPAFGIPLKCSALRQSCPVTELLLPCRPGRRHAYSCDPELTSVSLRGFSCAAQISPCGPDAAGGAARALNHPGEPLRLSWFLPITGFPPDAACCLPCSTAQREGNT